MGTKFCTVRAQKYYYEEPKDSYIFKMQFFTTCICIRGVYIEGT